MVTLCCVSIRPCVSFSTFEVSRPVRQPQKVTLMMSSDPSAGENALQILRSLSDYHEGEWKGRARSFTITPDIAAGIVQRKLSPEYTIAVKVSTSPGAVSLSETISWNDKISHRSIPLFTNPDESSSNDEQLCSGDLDVDDVDASYSTDFSSFRLPSILSGLSGNDNDKQKFCVEHCIAAGEDRRCRCFAIYGKDESLLRVVISDEKRVDFGETKNNYSSSDGKIESTTSDALTVKDLIEMDNDINRLVDKISANIDKQSSDSVPKPKIEAEGDNGIESVNDVIDINDTLSDSADTAASRLEKLGKSMAESNEKTTQDLLPYDISLLEFTNGAWLGDMIIRETPKISASPTEGSGKGFGKSSSPTSIPPRSFAGYDTGVQKLVWRWMWDFDTDEIRQFVDVGKSLGNPMDIFLRQSRTGNICVNESFSRRKPKNERMVYIDWEEDSAGFILGSFFVQVPRYVNFDPSATTSRATAVTKPFFTEFGVFLNDGPPSNNSNTAGVLDLQENSKIEQICCSKISRLYNYEGRLKQGCTSFYTFKRFDDDDDNNEDGNGIDVFE